MALAFERQEKESEKAFAAFSIYLSQGTKRSLARVAGKLGKSKVLMERWSRRWDWQGRLMAYAAHMALVEREAAEAIVRVKGVDLVKRQLEHREEEWKVRCELLEAAREALQKWRDSGRLTRPEAIARWLELFSELGRRSTEMATDLAVSHRMEVTGADGGPIRVEVEAALKKIYGQPLPGEVVDVEAEPVRPALLGGAPCGGPSA